MRRSTALRRTTDPASDFISVEAEQKSAFAIGLLQLFVVFAAPALLWDTEVVEHRNLVVWVCAEAALAVASFSCVVLLRVGALSAFHRISHAHSIGTALTFAALPWLGADVAGASPSRHVLMIALLSVTSIAAANSTYLIQRRQLFAVLVAFVAASYTAAYVRHGEWAFASLSVLWCLSIWIVTRVGYDSMVELQELRKASEKTARHDDLTGLLNRTAFFETLQHVARRNDAAARASVLVLIDLDGFKAINDGFGHGAGDAVLQAVADRLGGNLPADATLGRLGGDEFAAVFACGHLDLDATIKRTLDAVAEPVHIEGRELHVAASAGWTFVEPGELSAELMAQADAAMYQSKNSETTSTTGFNPVLRDELDRSLEIRQRFRDAVKRSEIEYWAQPLVRTADSAPVAVELLARWPQGAADEIGPLEFSRVADETGLAVELDRQALATARRLLTAWTGDPVLGQILVKANISPIHLHNNGLIESVRSEIPEELRSRLGLEFVESRLIPAAERNHAQLLNLMRMGLTLSIDDFGVGYSSLAYLRRLPISEIKIDASFVRNLDTDAVNRGLVRAIVDIAATLGLPTVVEGVESAAIFAAAAQLGVRTAQGFHIGHPMPLDDIAATLRALHTTAASMR